ncbi:MAG: hypothetical protein LC746_03045 [Acidobacteria bacterium]|nr:hypothetical protein [Acidobacteriota bacterium]
MDRFTNPLKHVRVAAPCPADWGRMRGDERVRFCDQCSLNVYNLSGLTRREAEKLLTSAEGRLCVRFYRRADGTILTNSCPVGLRAIKRRVSRVATAILSAVVSFFTGLGIASSFDQYRSLNAGETMRGVQTMGTVAAPAPRGADAPVMPSVEAGRAGWVNGRMSAAPLKSPRRSANPASD